MGGLLPVAPSGRVIDLTIIFGSMIGSILHVATYLAQSFIKPMHHSTAEAMSSKRLKRHRSVGAPPQVGRKLELHCGRELVPSNMRDSGDGMVTTVNISGSNSAWLLKSLGWRSIPCEKHVIQDIVEAISVTRGKRCAGLWKGKACTPVIQIRVRNQDIKVMNQLTTLELVVDDDLASLRWLVDELHTDLAAFLSDDKGNNANEREDEDHDDAGDDARGEGRSDTVQAAEEPDHDVDGGGEEEEEEEEQEEERAAWHEIKSLKTSSGKVWWVPSKHAFMVRRRGERMHEIFSVSRKFMKQRPLSLYVEALENAKGKALEFVRGQEGAGL